MFKKLNFLDSELTEDKKDELLEVLMDYQDVFAESSMNLGSKGVINQKIELVEDAKPFRLRPHRATPAD